jgi:hypothetical protein
VGSRGEGQPAGILVLVLLAVAGMVLAAAMALSQASAAAGKKGKKPARLGPVVTATATGPVATVPATTSAATATCPPGLEAVGGGFSAPFNSAAALVVNESHRSAPDSWRVSATLVTGAGAATAYAYCRRNALRVTDVSQAATLPSGPGQSILVEADCPPRTVAIGGGFRMTSGPEPGHLPIPEASIGGSRAAGKAPPLDYWYVLAQNSSTGAQTVTAHAYCATGIKPPAVRQDQASGTVPLLGSLTATSACPAAPKAKKSGKRKRKAPKRRLSAGGFSSPFFPGVLPVHAESRIVGDGFIDTAVNGGSVTGPMTVQSQAICF